MTEADIVANLSELYDRYWSVIQWWASTSFIVIGASHFASQRFSAVTVSILIGLYSAYSAWLYNFNTSNVIATFGFIQELINLEETSGINSPGAQAYLDGFRQNIGLLASTTMFGTYIVTVSYVIYCYRIAIRKTNTDESASST